MILTQVNIYETLIKFFKDKILDVSYINVDFGQFDSYLKGGDGAPVELPAIGLLTDTETSYYVPGGGTQNEMILTISYYLKATDLEENYLGALAKTTEIKRLILNDFSWSYLYLDVDKKTISKLSFDKEKKETVLDKYFKHIFVFKFQWFDFSANLSPALLPANLYIKGDVKINGQIKPTN